MNEEIYQGTAQLRPQEPSISPLKIARPFSKSYDQRWEDPDDGMMEGIYSNNTLESDESPQPTPEYVTYHLMESNPAPAGSSGTFGRLVRTTVRKNFAQDKSNKVPVISLNLHRFETENGDSLGDDPDVWARLTF